MHLDKISLTIYNSSFDIGFLPLPYEYFDALYFLHVGQVRPDEKGFINLKVAVNSLYHGPPVLWEGSINVAIIGDMIARNQGIFTFQILN